MTGRASPQIEISGRRVGGGQPTYVIAELSANHGQDLERAKDLVAASAEAGADAVKIQTYTADTMTIDAATPWFRVGGDSLWAGQSLHALYETAYTPWEWHAELRAVADAHGVDFFSTPFDLSAVDHLRHHHVPVYKIASFEIVDLELVAAAASTERPLIISTGMASVAEVDAAVGTARAHGDGGVALLRCNSAYPAPVDEMDLATIPHMASLWDVPVGLSDHTLGTTAAVAAVALGACIIEKHVTLSRQDETADAPFSVEPAELRALVDAVHEAEQAIGAVRYGPTPREASSLALRRSLFVVADVRAGDRFTEDNVRAIRPGAGLPPAQLPLILGRRAAGDVARGTPLSWDLIA